MKKRFLIRLQGKVQGVGFRPFVYRIALENNLSGFVKNSTEGAVIEVEGESKNLKKFIRELKEKKPPLVEYTHIEIKEIGIKNDHKFEIAKSEEKGEKIALILPDIAICEDCKEEIFDEKNRRFHYPFTNCTNCGPRFSIIQNIPYDRKNTTMKIFEMCKECKMEYEDPLNRRFHAQPNACHECGPQVFLLDNRGNLLYEKEKAIEETVKILKLGKIVAIKSIGGFQLLTDATKDESVLELRKRKKRDEKPFALMFKSLDHLKKYAYVNKIEKEILLSYSSPIVILKAKKKNNLSKYVSPYNPYIGAMLPYTPLHLLLMDKIDFPLVCTSGNISDEPIAFDNDEAFHRLKDITDYFLMHTRPIERYIDDSVVKVVNKKILMIRRARGYAPLPIIVERKLPQILALGAYLKNTIAISKTDRIIVSQHIGDLDNEISFNAFKKVIEDFKNLFEFKPEFIACDAHPEYLSTKYGEELSKKGNIPLMKIFHHHAHISSCMVENRLEEEVLGVAWDGTGYGKDGKIWGGEFLICDFRDFKRFATFREFGILGGDKAMREPRRSAIGILYEIYKEKTFEMDIESIKTLSDEEKNIFKTCYEKNINIFKCTSVGRIFDAVSSLLNLKQKITFEGQSAMILEWLAEDFKKGKIAHYDFELVGSDPIVIDFVPIIEGILNDLKNNVNKSYIAFKFHVTLAEIVKKLGEIAGNYKILLSGGVFQNKLLTELILKKVKKNKLYTHSLIPPNDGGISLGQIMILYHNL
ncbi:MAG: carbamoyltransferase HypF [Candidatus Hydrothermales bacterium]